MLTRLWEVIRPALQVVILLAVVVVCGLITVRALSAQRSAENRARAAELAHDGLIVQSEQTRRQLETRLKEEMAGSELFRKALAEAQERLSDPTPVAVIHASTGTCPVEYRPAPPPATRPASSTPVQPAGAECVLTTSEQGEVRVTEATIEESSSGVRVVVGAAECWRLSPDARLFGGTYSAPVTLATRTVASTSERRAWGAGGFVVVSNSGWAYGPAVAFPPVSVLGLQLEATVGGGVGSGGAQAGAMLIGRW